jgi:hypothetical protein
MKKIFCVTSAIALGLSVATMGFAGGGSGSKVPMGKLVEEILESVHGLDLLAINTAVNIADINGSVNITAGGSLQSAFPDNFSGDLGNIDDTLASFINTIDTVAIGAYANGTTALAAATTEFELTTNVTESESFSVDGSVSLPLSWSQDASLAVEHVELADFTQDKQLSLSESGMLGDTIALNAAFNTGDIDASVNIGGESLSLLNALTSMINNELDMDIPELGSGLATIDFTNVQISTTAIGAYNTGVINVGFTEL